MPWRFLRMEEHFELIKANFIRCEECNENFFFDFLRHPRYFVTHFKTCHLKNLLYRFNGYSEEENHKTRFGPRRKRDANAWFGQLKSTEKRMISMQDNKWSEITENECWSCRLCNDGKADLTHVFELNELGRGQAFLHLRQFHEGAYEAFLQSLPDVQNAALMSLREGEVVEPPTTPAHRPPLPVTSRTIQQRMAEAERSRLRRLRATSEEKKTEALRSKKRRENLTPVQRQADYDRRKRKKKRVEESVRSKKRREDASEATKEKEVLRSRERRRNATEEQRQREALRSRMRRQNATEEQKMKERERCRKRYEAKKAAGGRLSSSGAGTDDGGDSGHFSDVSTEASNYQALVQDDHALPPPMAGASVMPRYGSSAQSTTSSPPSFDALPPQHQQHHLNSQPFHSSLAMMMPAHAAAQHDGVGDTGLPAAINHPLPSASRSSSGPTHYQMHSMNMYNHHHLPPDPRSLGSASRASSGALFAPHPSTTMLANGHADIQLGFAVNPNLQPLALHHDHAPPQYFFDSDAALLSGAGAGFPSLPVNSTRANASSTDSTAL